MENSTAKGDSIDTIQALFCKERSTGDHWILHSSVSFFFSITAIFGNTLILIALHKESSLHPPSKLLYYCLAFTDLLVGLISQPSNALHNTLLASGQHLTELCVYFAATSTVSFTILTAVSLLTMTAVSVDRLLALLLGLRYRQIVTLKRVLMLATLFWITSIIFASMSFWKYAIPKGFNITLILLCIVVSVFCNSKIFLALSHNTMQVHHHGESNGGAGIAMNLERYKKTVATAICVLAALVPCYLPYSIVAAIVIFHGSSPLLDSIWDLTATVVCFNSSLNPILYCWKIRSVRQEVKNLIRKVLFLSN